MRRREFIAGLGSAAVARPLTAFGQVLPRRPVVSWLSGLTRAASSPYINKFLQGMRELGYVEGGNFDMVYRFSDGYQDRMTVLADELVRLKPDVIVATGTVNAVAARRATSTIPIVSPALGGAVHLGLVASEARPGGNVTGIEPYVEGLPAKQMQFALDIVPGLRRVGLLTDLSDPKAPPQFEELKDASRALKIDIVPADASRPDEIEEALRSLASQLVDVVIVLQTSMLLSEAQQIAASALAKRLPTVYGYNAHVAAGGLMSYGVDLLWCFYRGAYFVDRILHGTAPGSLPIEFPTKVTLWLNLKTASALGITFPATLLAIADEVIN
jgi:putative tryptophan/tyrosine transport system substrate-binding protein